MTTAEGPNVDPGPESTPSGLADSVCPVVVASMARTGSTLLQRALNTHPDLTIWGEHNGFLTDLMHAHRTITKHRHTRLMAQGRDLSDMLVGPLSDPEKFIPWVGSFRPREFTEATRRYLVDLFASPLPQNVRWGFKEIRYGADEMRFVRQLFPKTQFLVTVRDRRSQIRSRMLAFDAPPSDDHGQFTDEALRAEVAVHERKWIDRMSGYVEFAQQFPARTRIYRYEDLGQPGFDYAGVFDFLGLEPTDPTLLAQVTEARAGTTSTMQSTQWTDYRLALLDDVLAQPLDADAVALIENGLSALRTSAG